METTLTIKKIEKVDNTKYPYSEKKEDKTILSCEVHLEGSSEVILLLIPKIEALTKEQGWTL